MIEVDRGCNILWEPSKAEIEKADLVYNVFLNAGNRVEDQAVSAWQSHSAIILKMYKGEGRTRILNKFFLRVENGFTSLTGSDAVLQ